MLLTLGSYCRVRWKVKELRKVQGWGENGKRGMEGGVGIGDSEVNVEERTERRNKSDPEMGC